MHKYVVNSNYKFAIPIKLTDSDPQLSDEEWIRLYKQLFGEKKVSICTLRDNHRLWIV